MSSKNNRIMRESIECVRIAHQLAEVAGDWNLDEVEIDGEMVPTYEVADRFRRCLKVAKAAGIPVDKPAAPPAGEGV